MVVAWARNGVVVMRELGGSDRENSVMAWVGSGEEEEACGARGWRMAPRVSDEELWLRTSEDQLWGLGRR